MSKQKVLFVCIHNSARSQMAEELLRKMAGDKFEVESAGLEPGKLNSFVVEVLKEEGIDITGKQTKAVLDLLKAGKTYHYVIAVCDGASAEKCPVFPGTSEKIHWSFTDPSGLEGSDKEKIQKIRKIKKEIKDKLQQWLSSI
ncbi:Arsenate reductase thioredoxin-coupled, LMWP family [hydrothermal vent metagenome]|uniref:Arsenate reductase thioredoxin-coupled, LMWP family n=1 Tax=hydrothermal vent metagenome TaxID=652676 RepID=A0A3B1DFX8_9ZZZZ